MCRSTKTFGSNELIKHSLGKGERNRKYEQKKKNDTRKQKQHSILTYIELLEGNMVIFSGIGR